VENLKPGENDNIMWKMSYLMNGYFRVDEWTKKLELSNLYLHFNNSLIIINFLTSLENISPFDF
jgi:hypothetical protein